MTKNIFIWFGFGSPPVRLTDNSLLSPSPNCGVWNIVTLGAQEDQQVHSFQEIQEIIHETTNSFLIIPKKSPRWNLPECSGRTGAARATHDKLHRTLTHLTQSWVPVATLSGPLIGQWWPEQRSHWRWGKVWSVWHIFVMVSILNFLRECPSLDISLR